ncbi:MAG: U32 family peptidase [Oscillospiraceae bacterium]|nr:U32 family peptidase [Oscillospiraceae bacterium]
MEIGFHIPDFCTHFRLNNILTNMIESHPEYFHDGLKIRSVFGTFPGSVWNGGRYLGGTAEMRSINDIITVFNSKDIPLRFTFTNPLIKKEHLGDSFCNQVLRAANNGFNEVIVMSPILEEYIRENYPDYKITSSTCKQIEDMDGVRDEFKKDYKYVVLDYNWNNKFDELEKIDQADRERCEILVNACCTPHCPRRGDHYRHIGAGQIASWEHSKNLLNKQPYKYEDFECPYMNNNIYDITDLETHISPETIIDKYVPMGFKHFKIEGRTATDINLLETYVYYMVKPEHQTKVRFDMLTKLTEGIQYFTMH